MTFRRGAEPAPRHPSTILVSPPLLILLSLSFLQQSAQSIARGSKQRVLTMFSSGKLLLIENEMPSASSSPASGEFLLITSSSPASGGLLSAEKRIPSSSPSPTIGGILLIEKKMPSANSSPTGLQNFPSASGSGTEQKYVYRNSWRRRRQRVRWPQQPSIPTFELEDEMESFDTVAAKYGSNDSSKSRPSDWGFSETEISEIKFCASSWGNWRPRHYEDEAEEREIPRSKIQQRRPIAVVRPNLAEHQRKSPAAAKKNYENSVLPAFQRKRYELDNKISTALESLRLSDERPDLRPNFQLAPAKFTF